MRIGVYSSETKKEGYNPVTREKVQAIRKGFFADYELKLGKEYADWICSFLVEDKEVEI